MQRKCLIVLIALMIIIVPSIRCPLAVAQKDDDHPWPMVGGDIGNTGRSKIDTSHITGEELWNLPIFGGLFADTSPVIDGEGNLYFSVGHLIISLDRHGERRWNYTDRVGELTAPALGSDGRLYVGGRNSNRLYAVDKESGEQIWYFDTVGGVTNPPVVANERIYFASYDRDNRLPRIYAIDEDGNQIWMFDGLENRVNSRVAVGKNGWIYFGSLDKNVYALNHNGLLEWSYYTFGQVLSSPAVGDDDVIYVGAIDGLIALDAYDGGLRWYFPDQEHEEYGEAQVAIWGSPAIGIDGTIFFGCTYTEDFMIGRIYAMRPSGRVRWHMDTEHQLMSSTPVIGRDGTVYMGTLDDRKVYAFNPEGSIKWYGNISRGIDSSPAIGPDGTVYFVTVGDLPVVYAFGGEYIPTDEHTLQRWWIYVGILSVLSVSIAYLYFHKKFKDR